MGTNGNQEGKKVGYILTDKIFSRKLLTNYTWTGNSKNKTKAAFSDLKNIREFLFAVVSNAAEIMTEVELEFFF